MKLRLLATLALTPFLGFSQWSITQLGETTQLTFDQLVSGVNNGVFDGNGFSPSPTTGQLDSDAWRYTGLSSGTTSIAFGGTGNSGQAAKGVSNGLNGGMSGSSPEPGFYAYNTNNSGILSADYSLGWFSDGISLDPGTITLRMQNNTGRDINVVRFAYEAKELSRGPAETQVVVAYSLDDAAYTNVSSLGHTTVKPSVAQVWQSENKAAIIDNINWTNGSFLYIRWTTSYGTGSGYADAFAVDDIALRAYDVDYLWDGSTWSVGGTPAGSQTGSDALVLPSNSASIPTSTSLNNIFLEPGASLNIGTDLTVVGQASLFADGNGYSQVIGEIVGTTMYQSYRTTSGGRWFNVAIPVDADWGDVTGIPIQTVANPNQTNLWYYDANDTNGTIVDGTFKHITNKASAETELIGYQLYAGDGTHFGSGPFTMEVEGMLLDGSQDITVYGDTGGRFNFIPNPYPSTLDWDLAYAANSSELGGTYYIQDGEPDTGPGTVQYRTYTAGGSGTNGGSDDLPPGQAFFITVDASTDGTITFDNSDRNLTGNTTLFKTTANPGVIRFKTTQASTGFSDESIIKFESAQDDKYEFKKDAVKLMNTGYPNIYTQADSKNLVFNGLNNGFSTKSVNLYFQGDNAGMYDLNISLDGLPVEWTVILEDKATGTFTNLRKSGYTFSHAIGANADRFVVHFDKSGAVSIEERSDVEFFSYVKGDVLTVELDDIQNADISVFDGSGREMVKLSNQQGRVNINMSTWAKGVYLLGVDANGGQVYQNKIAH